MNKKINFRIVPCGYGKASKEVRDYITNLQQENERLKEDYNKAMDLVDKGVENSYKMLKDYKSRCEKAIEYIEDNTYYKSHKGYVDLNDLLNILQNGSDEE